MKSGSSKILEPTSTLKDINSLLRNSAKAALAISQFFIYEPLINKVKHVLKKSNGLLLDRSRNDNTENVSSNSWYFLLHMCLVSRD